MKNLNKKISVIALSGMAVFGGVAASVVPAFAASEVAVEQEVQDEGIKALNKKIKNASYKGRSFDYKAFASFKSKEAAKEALKKYGRANNHVRKVDHRLGRYLAMFADIGARVFILEENGNWYLVGLPDLLK